MLRRFACILLPLALLALPVAADVPLFERDVLPILRANCQGCHGGLFQKAGLDLRSIPLMLKGNEDGPAVVPGDAKSSPLWTAIESGEMPKGDKKLSDVDKQTLRQWIDAKLPTVAERQGRADPLLAGGSKHDPAEVARTIDRHVAGALKVAKLPVAGASDDVEFLRRAYIDLSGRVPTAVQATAFLDSTDPDKRAKLIDALLATPQFGEQLGRTWRDWIAPPELPSDANGGKQPHSETQALGKWLGERFAAGDSWDVIARAMLLVEGERKNQPQQIFYPLLGDGGKVTAGGMARGTAALLMGVNLQCAQCHDDPYRTWSQEDYWALAAFFRNVQGDFNKVTEASKPDPKIKQKAPADKSLAGHITIPATAFRNAGKSVAGRFLGGPPVEVQAEQPLRPMLADWITSRDNPYFARAFVNRMWFYFFNRGIVHPVDDLRDLNPPSHPGLLALLEQEFKDSGYDVKHLVRCIARTESYQRTSRPSLEQSPLDAERQVAMFGRMPLRLMTADVLYDSLKLAYADPKLDLRTHDPKDGNTNGESAPVGDAYLEFQRAFCTNEEDTADFTHGIPQLLTLLNHPRLTTTSKPLDEARKPLTTPDKSIEWLYLSTLSRRPDADELRDARRYMDAAEDPTRAFVGVLWMLVNRSEFMVVR